MSFIRPLVAALATRSAMSGIRDSLLMAAALVLAAAGPALAQDAPPPAIPLSEVLLEDGTLDLTRGQSGSVDIAGYHMALAPGGAPMFPTAGAGRTVGSGGWDSEIGNPGAQGWGNRVWAMAVADDGSLYVGGNFVQIGGVEVNRVARWDGTEWHSLGTGVNSDVLALAVSGTNVYVGGRFTHAGEVWVSRVARWDGKAWHAFRPGELAGVALSGGGSGVAVHALAIRDDGDLYVGGLFDRAGDHPASNLARWDGANWHSDALTFGTNRSVYALGMAGSDLYVGGTFTLAGGETVDGIARWDGSSWHSLGSGLSSQPTYPEPQTQAIAIMGTDVYVAGWFFRADGVVVNNIARWDGESWHPLEDAGHVGLELEFLNALTVLGTDLYVSGGFSHAGGEMVNRIARWDGSSWHSLGSGEQAGVTFSSEGAPRVYTLAAGEEEVFVGGWFDLAGGLVSRRIARWVPKPVGTEPDPDAHPTVSLADIHPNPLTNTTHVQFVLADAAPIRLEAFDLLGRRVAVIADDLYPAGRHEVELDAVGLAVGVYVVRLTSGSFSQTRRVTVVR